MYRSILMGLVVGQHAMTPLSALAGATRRGTVHDNPATRLMARPLFATGGVPMAVAEMVGDKTKTAPAAKLFVVLQHQHLDGAETVTLRLQDAFGPVLDGPREIADVLLLRLVALRLAVLHAVWTGLIAAFYYDARWRYRPQ